jgi:uncharacterized damage-inducible protein DinB
MFDRNDALELFEYDRWANGKIAERLAGLAVPLPQAEKLLAHLVGAEEVWYERVSGGEYQKLAVWPEGLALAEVRKRFAAIADAWRAHLEQADAREFARKVEFKNSAGEPCADPLEAIVRHVVSHGAHHRGQIASLLRAAGHVPETLDYIVWRRMKQREEARAPAAWKHFVIESTYLADLSKIDEKLAAHRAHLETGFRAGLLLASGPQVPRTGGMILARAKDRAEIE